MNRVILSIIAVQLVVLNNGCAENSTEPRKDGAGTEKKGEETMLTNQDKEFLINLARQTVSWYVKDRKIPKPDKGTLSEAVQQKAGCFVTLTTKPAYKGDNGLRGCIGVFERDRPLYENVISRAIAAATEDTRFNPVKYSELDGIKIEISVLTEPKDFLFKSPEDLLARLRPLKDGVILRTRYGGSTFLPQVWEQLPDKEQFLSHLCMKHGAPGNAWKNDYKNVQVLTYEAIVFGEEEYGRKVTGVNGAVVGKGGAVIEGTAAPAKKGAEKTAGRKAAQGTKLEPGTVCSPGSDITDIQTAGN